MHNIIKSIFLLLLNAVTFSVYAAVDVPTSPPPIHNVTSATPAGNSLINMGYDSSTDTLRLSSTSGPQTQYTPSNGSYSGSNTVNVTAKDKYGASASGKVNTTTKVSASSIAKGFGALFGANIGSVVERAEKDGIGKQLANGDFAGAAATATNAIANALTGGLPDALNKIFDDYYTQKVRDAQKKYDAGQLKVDEAKKIGYRGYYDIAYMYCCWGYYKHQLALSPTGVADHEFSGGWFSPPEAFKSPPGFPEFELPIKNNCDANGSCEHNYDAAVSMHPATEADFYKYLDTLRPAPPTTKDFIPTSTEAQDALQKALNDATSALNKNTQVLSSLINSLVTSGNLNSTNTVTTVDAPISFSTDPYTPASNSAGENSSSSTPQQTKFTVDKNGNISAETVKRPDLAPNSAQAPARVPVGSSASNSTHGNNKPNEPTDTQPDICAQNPNALGCIPAGDAGYKDPEFEHEDYSNFDFSVGSWFAENGTCPAPLTVSFMHTNISLSFEPMCDIASKVKPIVILSAVVIAMFIVIGAL